MQASPEVQKVLDRLDKVRADGSGWSAACPCRDDDQNPSLHVGMGRDGKVLLTCHRGNGCNYEEICQAINLEPKDLFPPDPEPRRNDKLELVEEYAYTDEDGEILFWKAKYRDSAGKKTFRQYRKRGSEKVWNLDGVPKVLYRLPAVRQAVADGDVIVVVEGEKDVHSVERLGFTATTMPGGAGKWLDLHTEALAGAVEVVIVADNDDAGLEHATTVFRALKEVVTDVSVVRAPAPHKDISDAVAAGLGFEHLEPWDPDYVDPLVAVAEAIRGFEGPLEKRVAKALRQVRAIESPAEDPGRLVHWVDFLAETAGDDYDWVIPGLLERGDRVIIVAAEGQGKTILMRHMALCLGVGLHPFTRGAIKPMRTLTVDLENPDRIVRRTGRRIHHGVVTATKTQPDAHLLLRRRGMNLLSATDQQWLHERIEQIQPDVVFLGPLYKSFIDPGGRTSEAVTTEVAMVFDEIVETYGVAMVFEHHAPLGDKYGREIRPFGSSVWSRWPEFGIGLVPDVDSPGRSKVTMWRGPREERDWPVALRRGSGLFMVEAEFG